MSVSNSVTEKGVTVTASAPIDEIRTSAGFAAETDLTPGIAPPTPSSETETKPETKPEAEPTPDPTAAVKRADDGTFRKGTADPRKSFQAKIDYEVKRRADAERRADEAERRARELEAQTQPARMTEAKPSNTWRDVIKGYETDPEWPASIDDFADPYAALSAARAAFINRKQIETTTREAEQSRQREEQRARVAQSHEAGAKKYADWGDLFKSDAAQVDLPAAVLNELYSDPDSSADVIHHLLTHEDDLLALTSADDPIAAARAVTALRTTVTLGTSSAPTGPETSPRPVTRAKPLIKPVSGSPAAPEAKSIDDLPFGPGFVKATAEQERKWKNAHRGA
jgi:hypothetical protein